ncbi:Ff.00g108160.m01.CDS01 [Fusarium sp. VM40]|nr:Ff.00g108160.m01.CDS01 [Fusarium sp. VM40]
MSNLAESQSDDSENERLPNEIQGEEESSGNESSDESSDHSDGGGLLDTMAADTDDDSGDESDDEDNDHYETGLRKSSNTDYFPQFCRLPIELRNRIWELFCPELCARYRVLDFLISYGTTRHPESATSLVWTVRDGIALEDQTRNLRTVFAVCQESRALATNAFPNSLSIDAGTGDAIVAFNQNSDVVLVNGLTCPPGRNIFHLPEFASEIKNLALGGPDILDNLSGSDVPTLVNQFTQLETFYVDVSSTDCQKSSLAWCTSDLVNHYQTQTYEKQPGLGEDLQFLWCWPDLQRHPDFARFQINRDTWDNLPDPLGSTLERRGLKAWPMVAFEYERGLRRYEMLQTLGPDMGDDTSSEEEGDDEDDGSNLDEYESDGIDDNEILETYDDSDEEGISLASGSPAPASRVIHEVSDDDDEEDEDGDVTGAGTGVGANFSSPEPEEEHESVPVQRGRKRRVVSDSDDEDEEDVQPTKRARTGRVVESDDEDDEPEVAQVDPPQKRSRTIISDDEDDDDASEQGGVSRQSDADDASDSQEDSEEESEESDDDAPPAKMSLAERLRLHREENPVNNQDSDDDASSRTADADSEDDEDVERNPFMIGMADESDGEGEDDDEDDY